MNESLSVVVDLLIVFVGLRKNPHHLRCGIQTQDAGEGVNSFKKALRNCWTAHCAILYDHFDMSIEKNDIEVIYRE